MRKRSVAAQVQMVRDIQRASRNLCHRQLSWFRDEPLFQWVDAARQPSDIVNDIIASLADDTHKGAVLLFQIFHSFCVGI